MTTHYDTLEVARGADPVVIERAYRALAAKYHPDRAPADRQVEANSRMAALNEAYRVLSDPVARGRYDATLPAQQLHGWDVFMERGLVGLFLERFGR